MSDRDPYQPPVDALGEPPRGPSPPDGKAHTELMLTHLQGTKPWVLFLSILGFIGAGLMGLFALIALIAGIAAGSGDGGAGETAAVIGIAVFYLLLGVLHAFFAYLLIRYSTAIGHALSSDRTEDVEEALLRQKTVWKTVGIATIVLIGISFLGIVAGIIIAVATNL
jgi:hypothetical protein